MTWRNQLCDADSKLSGDWWRLGEFVAFIEFVEFVGLLETEATRD